MADVKSFLYAVDNKRMVIAALEEVRVMQQFRDVIGGETLDSLTLELLKARREADRRLARAITEFEQNKRNERED